MKYNSSEKCNTYKESSRSLKNLSFNYPVNIFSSNFCDNKNICIAHNINYDNYCLTCLKDLCPNCLKNHTFHKIIKYEEPPSKEEINILKNRIKLYKSKFSQLLYEIKKWKNILEKKIKFLENIFSARKIIDFVNNYEIDEKNVETIIKFKKIFSMIASQEIKTVENNENDNNLEYLNYQQYILCKYLLDFLNSHKGAFMKNGIEIIKYLSEVPINNTVNREEIILTDDTYESINSNITTNITNIRETVTGAGNSNNEYENLFKCNNERKYHCNTYTKINYENINNKISRNSENPKIRNTINSMKRLINNNNNDISNSYNSFNKNFTFNNHHMYNTFYSLSNNNNKNNNKIRPKRLYSKKLINSVLKINHTDFFLNQSANIEPKTLFSYSKGKNHSNSNILTINFPLKRGKSNNIIQKRRHTLDAYNNINTDNNNNINYMNKLNEIKNFTHKKYIRDNSVIIDDNSNININLNATNNSFKKTNTEKTLKKNLKNVKKNSLLFTNKLYSCPIKLSLFLNMPKKDSKSNLTNNIIEANEEEEEKDFFIRIIKTTAEKQFKINQNKSLNIGFNLDNSSCKLSIIDQKTNDIQLISFKKDCYEIPTIIYLDENSEEIKIGHEAENLGNLYPSQTISNLVKLFCTDFDEISEQKKLWPFKIFRESNGRIFIKMNYCGKKDKKFYIENLLILFFEEIFKKFFSKVIIEEDKIKEIKETKDKNRYENSNILNINICVTIPYYFNYIKRKVLEKIFQKHIFQNMNINYNCSCNCNINYDNNSMCSSSKQSTFSTINYNSLSSNKRNKNNKTLDINLNNIKIENSPSPSVLCLQNNTNEESISSSFSFQSCSKENNILILNISGDSTSISITSISNEKKNCNNNLGNKNNYIKKYEVKNIENLNFGEEDFINNYLFYNLKSLKDINLDIYNNIIKNPISLSTLQNIFKKNIDLFDTKPQIEIKINKLLYNFDLNLIINKQDYINSCSDLYNKIMSSIKNTISQSKLSEILIDDLILIGQMSKCSHMKKLLCELFKNNKIIYNKIRENNFENDEFYLVAGTGLEAMNQNLNNNLKKYIFNDICPISYGIENAIGEVDLIIKKGNKIPVVQKNFVKIFKNKNSDFLDIKICEINNENKKIILSYSNINGKNMKLFPSDNDNKDNELVELLFEFEIDINFNLSVFILDKKTFKRRFEFSINIDVIKDK